MFEYRKVPKHWKYILTRDTYIRLSMEFVPNNSNGGRQTDFIKLVGRWLILKKGYAWDGPSGPTFDTYNAMEGSAAHDALWQLIMKGLLDKKYKRAADRELRLICIRNGMKKWRAWLWYNALGLVTIASRKRKLDKIYKLEQK